ncbi:hypothetical protein SAMN06295888_10371 [Desulfonatronum zhilinae]|nr:hypothetical protein SAMN06295888_10371 [Desulfonatronum zhilinae]
MDVTTSFDVPPLQRARKSGKENLPAVMTAMVTDGGTSFLPRAE